MDFIAYQNAMRGIYSIAHAVAENGQEQDRIVRNIQQTEVYYVGKPKEIVKLCLQVLLKELE